MNSQLQPLSPVQHLGTGLRTAKDWSFCQPLDAVPIALNEFADLSCQHPIIFSLGSVPQPLAILGTQAGKNDFLDAQHQWPPHHKVPIALQHHPFSITKDSSGATRAIVLIDASASRLVPLEEDDSAVPLFTFDGHPSPLLSTITQELGIHWRALQEGIAFGQALNKTGLLEDVRATIRLSDGSTHTTRTFRRVKLSAYRALPEMELNSWFRRGWIDAIAVHLASLNRWMHLFERSQQWSPVNSPQTHVGE
ncbi:SapC family protein [Comamonas sp. JUb58]|uniref:SapC family protein n=1 Tax=Comamonas sp. JUb58 TaxID=2485114 RepID=UPI00105C77C8|nr:SapC family protein [Comamonas sp. JUb58]TDS69619.1 SapC protein [Comamonas sp. JUb58]